MEQNQKIERMKALIATLNAASQAYYQESRELMPNHAYDALYDELAAILDSKRCCAAFHDFSYFRTLCMFRALPAKLRRIAQGVLSSVVAPFYINII